MSEVTQRNFPAKFFEARITVCPWSREAKKLTTPRNVSNGDTGSLTGGIEFSLQIANKNTVIS